MAKPKPKPKDLDAALAAIKKKFGPLAIRYGDTYEAVDYVPTGIFALDMALGGGIARERITQFKGKESGGKSLVAYKAIRAFQQLGEVVALVDVEHAFDPRWLAKQGVDLEKLIISQPSSAEQGIDVVEGLVHTMDGGLIVFDSIAAATPSDEIEASTFDWQTGLHPRLINKMHRKVTAAQNGASQSGKRPATLITINQTRFMIGGSGGKTTPGGEGQKFHSSVIVDMRPGKEIGLVDGKLCEPAYKSIVEGKALLLGRTLYFYVAKNKTAPAFRRGDFALLFAHGVDDDGRSYMPGDTNLPEQTTTLGIYWGVIEQKQAWYSFKPSDDESTWLRWQGKAAVVRALADDPELLSQIQFEVGLSEQEWRDGPGAA